MRQVANVLFVSVENALRSQLAEACLRHVAKGRLNAFSCGVPGRMAHAVSPIALEVLHRAGMPIAQLKPKSWDLFKACLLYTSPSPRDQRGSRMPSSA